MAITLALISLTAWLITSRWLFRRWIRNDSLTAYDRECSHGYTMIHKQDPCQGRHPLPHAKVAALAAGAALALPATLFLMAIMRNPPMSRRELAERTASLEEENRKLRQAAELRGRRPS